MIEEKIKRVAVVGSNGKMGRGIAMLLLQEMARCEAQATGKVGEGEYRLSLIDPAEEGQPGLKKYLRTQLKKYAEKNISTLRTWFASNQKLVDNGEIIEAFVEGACNITTFDTSLQAASGASLIFEAVLEDFAAKQKVFIALKQVCNNPEVYYFTNTSSIPISMLDSTCELNHRIIGFHFYNPPLLQKLVEVITSKDTEPGLVQLAAELGHRLGKILVPSHDIAGFIGNGHFIREISFACQQVERLKPQYTQEQALAMINQITEVFMLRPMGIFQLADYVGLDVCYHISEVMRQYISQEAFHFDLIAAFLKAGIKGGQFPDGSQRDGIFQYNQGKAVGVYSFTDQHYKPLDVEAIGLPPATISWKALTRDTDAAKKLPSYFNALFAAQSLGSQIAQSYLLQSKQIAQDLVKHGVAEKVEDVNTVLKTGFAHVYGPVNSYF